MNVPLNEIETLKCIINESDITYLKYHALRYELLVKFVKNNYSNGKKILDIGNSRFTKILAKLFNCKVDQLGFSQDSVMPFGNKYQFDLNNCYHKSKWRSDIGLYDIIIFTEVIEHLYTSPTHVLNYLSSILNKNGKIILQTPNAAVLHKRLQLLVGKNPYMLIKESRRNPGHFREYTKSELIGYVKNCGLNLDTVYYGNYFSYQYAFNKHEKRKMYNLSKLVKLLYSILPSSLKPGITMILSKK